MIELNKIYNEDCIKGMQRIPSGSVDAVISDPPYGITKCNWDKVVDFKILWQEFYRILKPHAAIVLFAGEPFTSHLILSNINEFREKLTWVKHKPSNFGCAKYRQLRYTEDIVVFGHHITFNPQTVTRTSPRIAQAQKTNYIVGRGRESSVSFSSHRPGVNSNCYSATTKYEGNILFYPSVQGNSHEKTKHPTQKPVPLISQLLKTYTNPGDTVIDPFIGSGTTAVACQQLQRNFIGFENNPEYFTISNQRINPKERT